MNSLNNIQQIARAIRNLIEYEPESGALTVSGIKTADVTASDSITATVPVVLVKASSRITLDTPEVVCTNKLTTGTLEVKNGGTMSGNIEHTGGTLKSNGVQVDNHLRDKGAGHARRSGKVGQAAALRRGVFNLAGCWPARFIS